MMRSLTRCRCALPRVRVCRARCSLFLFCLPFLLPRPSPTRSEAELSAVAGRVFGLAAGGGSLLADTALPFLQPQPLAAGGVGAPPSAPASALTVPAERASAMTGGSALASIAALRASAATSSSLRDGSGVGGDSAAGSRSASASLDFDAADDMAVRPAAARYLPLRASTIGEDLEQALAGFRRAYGVDVRPEPEVTPAAAAPSAAASTSSFKGISAPPSTTDFASDGNPTSGASIGGINVAAPGKSDFSAAIESLSEGLDVSMICLSRRLAVASADVSLLSGVVDTLALPPADPIRARSEHVSRSPQAWTDLRRDFVLSQLGKGAAQSTENATAPMRWSFSGALPALTPALPASAPPPAPLALPTAAPTARVTRARSASFDRLDRVLSAARNALDWRLRPTFSGGGGAAHHVGEAARSGVGAGEAVVGSGSLDFAAPPVSNTPVLAVLDDSLALVPLPEAANGEAAFASAAPSVSSMRESWVSALSAAFAGDFEGTFSALNEAAEADDAALRARSNSQTHVIDEAAKRFNALLESYGAVTSAEGGGVSAPVAPEPAPVAATAAPAPVSTAKTTTVLTAPPAPPLAAVSAPSHASVAPPAPFSSTHVTPPVCSPHVAAFVASRVGGGGAGSSVDPGGTGGGGRAPRLALAPSPVGELSSRTLLDLAEKRRVAAAVTVNVSSGAGPRATSARAPFSLDDSSPEEAELFARANPSPPPSAPAATLSPAFALTIPAPAPDAAAPHAALEASEVGGGPPPARRRALSASAVPTAPGSSSFIPLTHFTAGPAPRVSEAKEREAIEELAAHARAAGSALGGGAASAGGDASPLPPSSVNALPPAARLPLSARSQPPPLGARTPIRAVDSAVGPSVPPSAPPTVPPSPLRGGGAATAPLKLVGGPASGVGLPSSSDAALAAQVAAALETYAAEGGGAGGEGDTAARSALAAASAWAARAPVNAAGNALGGAGGGYAGPTAGAAVAAGADRARGTLAVMHLRAALPAAAAPGGADGSMFSALPPTLTAVLPSLTMRAPLLPAAPGSGGVLAGGGAAPTAAAPPLRAQLIVPLGGGAQEERLGEPQGPWGEPFGPNSTPFVTWWGESAHPPLFGQYSATPSADPAPALPLPSPLPPVSATLAGLPTAPPAATPTLFASPPAVSPAQAAWEAQMRAAAAASAARAAGSGWPSSLQWLPPPFVGAGASSAAASRGTAPHFQPELLRAWESGLSPAGGSDPVSSPIGGGAVPWSASRWAASRGADDPTALYASSGPPVAPLAYTFPQHGSYSNAPPRPTNFWGSYDGGGGSVIPNFSAPLPLAVAPTWPTALLPPPVDLHALRPLSSNSAPRAPSPSASRSAPLASRPVNANSQLSASALYDTKGALARAHDALKRSGSLSRPRAGSSRGPPLGADALSDDALYVDFSGRRRV
jgi:hypothetical protein